LLDVKESTPVMIPPETYAAQHSKHPRAALALTLALSATLSLAPRESNAFCGFYVSGSSEQLTNKATRVALMRYGQRTVLTMSNDYDGPPQDFAMVVPVPIVLQQDNVKTLPHDVFSKIEALTAPRLVEYWEQDPCEGPIIERRVAARSITGSRSTDDLEGGSGTGLGVRVEARFEVGEYQIVILSATQSSGLEAWLRQNRYNIPQGAAAALAPYIREGMKFFVARVNLARAHRRADGGARLSPLRFHYDTQDFRLPVRLGLLNAPEKQDLIVYVLHPTSRFEVANYPNVFIPTNLDLDPSMRDSFGRFYTTLFDHTLDRMNGRAVVTEYAWATSTCDPCPTPPLDASDLATLGLDVIDPSATQRWQYSQFASGMTVTRLHTRYNAQTLNEDLVFREAGMIVGGREHIIDPQTGAIEQGARPDAYTNNFQARYAIRHPWTGPIRCRNPRRGLWGGPPVGQSSRPVRPALDLATRSGSAVDLRRAVQSAVPELGITGRHAGSRGSAPAREQPRSTRGTSGATSNAAPNRHASIALGSAGILATLALGLRRWSTRR
jgi:hypothetical protein